MALKLRCLVVVMLVMVAAAEPSTSVFGEEDIFRWTAAICSGDMTCSGLAARCYNRVAMTKAFLTDLSNPSATLHDRCNKKRNLFNTCAEEAKLNATWYTITGSNRDCEDSFLRGLQTSEPLERVRRQIPTSINSGPGTRKLSLRFKRDLSKLLGRVKRQGRRFTFDPPVTGVSAFFERVQKENPEAKTNYTRCVLRQEGMLHHNGSVHRLNFMMWASVAFVSQPTTAEAVRTAITNCGDPVDGKMATYMQCWGQACVNATKA